VLCRSHERPVHDKPLEPKTWDDGSGADDKDAPQTFRQTTKLSQHISFLKDFFRCYKDFDDKHIDVIELMLGKAV
jgi:hypothetical protein